VSLFIPGYPRPRRGMQPRFHVSAHPGSPLLVAAPDGELLEAGLTLLTIYQGFKESEG
jgi:hypothetical protein